MCSLSLLTLSNALITFHTVGQALGALVHAHETENRETQSVTDSNNYDGEEEEEEEEEEHVSFDSLLNGRTTESINLKTLANMAESAKQRALEAFQSKLKNNIDNLNQQLNSGKIGHGSKVERNVTKSKLICQNNLDKVTKLIEARTRSTKRVEDKSYYIYATLYLQSCPQVFLDSKAAHIIDKMIEKKETELEEEAKKQGDVTDIINTLREDIESLRRTAQILLENFLTWKGIECISSTVKIGNYQKLHLLNN